jgi:hypothetical protein
MGEFYDVFKGRLYAKVDPQVYEKKEKESVYI